MTQQVTEADREWALELNQRLDMNLSDLSIERLAGVLTAATRRGEIAEHKKLCDDCEPERPCERIKVLLGS